MFKYIYGFLDKVKSKLSEKGQGMVEYALIIAFVAAIAAVALNSDNALGAKIKTAFTNAGTQIDQAGTGSTTGSTGGGGGGGTTTE